MIDKKGRIKVLDFGIAKMQASEEKGLTKTGIQIGTAAYMSPEQVNAKKVDKLYRYLLIRCYSIILHGSW
jgi:serine/threonine-protein kinase